MHNDVLVVKKINFFHFLAESGKGLVGAADHRSGRDRLPVSHPSLSSPAPLLLLLLPLGLRRGGQLPTGQFLPILPSSLANFFIKIMGGPRAGEALPGLLFSFPLTLQ